MSVSTPSHFVFDSYSDRLWICFGFRCELKIYEVNVERGTMMDIDSKFQFGGRAFSMNCLNENLVLVGTLCGSLLAFSINDR